MKEVDEIPKKIGINEICLYRKGSDIDLEAIFGGRMSTKKKNGIKTNPVFKDGQGLKKGGNGNSDNDMGGIEIKVYNNIPKSTVDSSKENNNLKMKELLTKENSRTERDKVTVTNGDVCVGDIIIENGHRNPAFSLDVGSISGENEGSGVLEHTVKYNGEGDGGGNMSGTQWPNIDDIALPVVPQDQSEINDTTKGDEAYETIDYNRNHKKLKNGIDSSDIKIDITSENTEAVKQGSLESSEVQNVSVSVNETGKFESDILKNKIEKSNDNKSDCNINTSETLAKYSPEKSSECHTQAEKQNEVTKEKVNGSMTTEPKMNGSVNSNSSLVNDLILDESIEGEKGKSKKKNKKLKQRKNSLPDHILNSLSMKPSKPILVPVDVDNSAKSVGRSRSADMSCEQKSVKFSDDTVFNDNKPNKYKQERVNVRDIYKGKTSSKDDVAKMNPAFLDEDNRGLKDDEKIDQNGLNTPAYMKDYITSHEGDEAISVKHAGLAVDDDIESIGSETIKYDRLIKKIEAKKRRGKVVRVTCAIFTFCVVIGIVVVLVIFVGKKQS